MQIESAVLPISDIHYGKRTSAFNPQTCLATLDYLADRLGRIRALLSDYQIDELVVAFLGDFNDGSDIYATQAHHQAISDVQKQAYQLSDHLADWLRSLKKQFPKIRVECVPGNHGRVGKFAHEAANWDIVTYNYTKLKLAGDDIPVYQNEDADPFIRKIYVRNHPILLYHGHDIRSFASIPWYGINLRQARWQSTRLAPFEVVAMGHFHSFGRWKINNVEVLMNGTFVRDDEWALRTLGWESACKAWLFGVSDKRPITWSFGLDLDDESQLDVEAARELPDALRPAA